MVEMAASSSRWCDAAALVSAAGFSAIFGGIISLTFVVGFTECDSSESPENSQTQDGLILMAGR
jgi:hypothetical protein